MNPAQPVLSHPPTLEHRTHADPFSLPQAVVAGLAQVVHNVTTCLSELQPQEIAGDAATSIVNSFSQFAAAQTTLLNTLASKAVLCVNLPYLLSPIASLLGGLDGSVNVSIPLAPAHFILTRRCSFTDFQFLTRPWLPTLFNAWTLSRAVLLPKIWVS